MSLIYLPSYYPMHILENISKLEAEREKSHSVVITPSLAIRVTVSGI